MALIRRPPPLLRSNPVEESTEEIKSANHGRAVFRKGPVRDRETVGSMDIGRAITGFVGSVHVKVLLPLVYE
jgi:hypothetical protein